MSRVKVRSAHLGANRPVPASRAVGGPVRLVFVRDVRVAAAMIAATSTGILAVALAAIGAVVTS